MPHLTALLVSIPAKLWISFTSLLAHSMYSTNSCWFLQIAAVVVNSLYQVFWLALTFHYFLTLVFKSCHRCCCSFSLSQHCTVPQCNAWTVPSNVPHLMASVPFLGISLIASCSWIVPISAVDRLVITFTIVRHLELPCQKSIVYLVFSTQHSEYSCCFNIIILLLTYWILCNSSNHFLQFVR